jgi:hypothetical protein
MEDSSHGVLSNSFWRKGRKCEVGDVDEKDDRRLLYIHDSYRLPHSKEECSKKTTVYGNRTRVPRHALFSRLFLVKPEPCGHRPLVLIFWE